MILQILNVFTIYSSPQSPSQDVAESALRTSNFGLQSTPGAGTSISSTVPAITTTNTASKYNRRSERRLSLTANPKLNTIHEPNGSSSLTTSSSTSQQDPTNTLSSKSRSVSLMDGNISH